MTNQNVVEQDKDISRLLATRYSCRAYEEREVPRRLQEEIFTEAQKAASWCNSQPWQVTVVSGNKIKELGNLLFAAAERGEPSEPDLPFPAAYEGVYLARRRECGFGLYEAVGIQRGDRAASARQMLQNFRMFGAPHVAILTTDAQRGVYGAGDVGGYLQTLMLVMQSRGLSCIPQAALANYSALVKSFLGIPAERKMVCGLSFGYGVEQEPVNQFRTSRATLDEVVAWQD